MQAAGGSTGAQNAARSEPEAVTRFVAWQQLSEEMKRQGLSKADLAECMHSRAQVGRILKAKGNVTVESLQQAAALVGRELRAELV